MAAVLIGIVLVPVTFVFCRGNFCKKKQDHEETDSGEPKQSCKCSVCQDKPERPRKVSKKTKSRATMVVKLVILVFFWYVLFEIINIIKDVSFDEYATFDPWVTLGIDTSASRSEIKSAYRKLSKIYHPDKNKGNKEAEQVFMEIVKANNILTDDLARSNWEKYGNPDGPRMLKIGIGCPEFLLKKENHNIILVVFFVVMLIVIPGAAFYLTRRKDDEERIAGDIQHLYTTLNENLNIKQCPLLLAGCQEIYSELPLRKEDNDELQQLQDELGPLFPKLKYDYPPKVIKAMLLVLAHMNKYDLSEDLNNDLNDILLKSGDILDLIIGMSYKMGMDPRMKSVGLRAISLIVEFKQMLAQGAYQNENPMFQLPYINPGNLKDLFPGKRGSIRDLVISGDLGPAEGKLATTEAQDIREALKAMPNFKCNIRVATEVEDNIWDDQVCIGDLATVLIEIDRVNIEEGFQVGNAHSLNLPFKTPESIYVLVAETTKNSVIFAKKIVATTKTFTDKTIKFLVGKDNPLVSIRAGRQTWEAHVKSDSYIGFDMVVPVTFTVKRARKEGADGS